MATITTSEVVKISLDCSGETKTISLDNPKSGLTLNQIENAFAPAISGGWLINYSGKGGEVTAVKSAEYETVTRTTIDRTNVTLSPNKIQTETSTTTASLNYTISGISATTDNVIIEVVTAENAAITRKEVSGQFLTVNVEGESGGTIEFNFYITKDDQIILSSKGNTVAFN